MFGLGPDEPAEAAVRHMALQIASHARLYEPGMLADSDTEFLHQYRVSLRRTRSLLSLTKTVFTPRTFSRLMRATDELMAPTGTTRDLDVFLLERSRYESLLPDGFEAGMAELFTAITRDRQRAQAALARRLQTKAHQDAYRRLLQTLEAAPEYRSKASARPILKLARHKLHKRYRKIVSLGAQIDAATPDTTIHKLRIECKKLRYLLELFRELLPPKALKPALSELRRLQDILGEFNDYAVQQRFLLQYGRGPNASVERAAAIGGLTAVLHGEQHRVRGQVQAAVARFGKAGNQRRFARLLDLSTRRP